MVAFDTAYGGDRMRAFLFLPKNGSPPYETVIFSRRRTRFSCDPAGHVAVRDGLHRRKRTSVPYLVYKGTYERATHGEEDRTASAI